jgi:3',5'-cyclic AMP phosphodiesterase CpdA
MRIALVADSHLAPEAKAFNINWMAVAAFIQASNVDLTIHLGDITVDGFADPSQFAHVLSITTRWPTPIRYLPGNHDIGDNPPGPNMGSKHPLNSSRILDFRAAFGPDYWAFDADGWRVIGLNAQLFGTDDVEAIAQWTWLASMSSKLRDRPVVLMLHKPLFQQSPDDKSPHHRYVPIAARRRLFDLLGSNRLRVVCSGHTHQYRDTVVDGMRHVWLPSTAFYLPDAIQDRVGEKIVGLGLLELTANGYRLDLVCPDGVTRHNALDHPMYPELIAARAAEIHRTAGTDLSELAGRNGS